MDLAQHRSDAEPPSGASRLLLAAMLIDTLGGGLATPFELLFGQIVVGLPLSEVGLAISIGTGAAIAVGPLAGALVDRFGPIRVVATANVTSAAGSSALLVIHGFGPFLVISFVLAAAQRTFWAAYAPLVVSFVRADRLEGWFGRFRGTRYAGIAIGAAAASLALLPGQEVGLRLVIVLDALSYLAAMGMLLIAARRRGAEPLTGPADPDERLEPQGRPGYLPILRDRANLILASLNVAATLIIILPLLALPVFVLQQLHLPTWLPGILVALATVTIASFSTFSGRLTRGYRRLALLALAAALWTTGALLFAVVAWMPPLWLVLLPAAMVILGIGEGLYAPIADALPLALAPSGLAGRYSAMHQLAWGVSGTIAPGLAAWLLLAGPEALWLTVAAVSGLTAVTYLALQPRFSERTGVVGPSNAQ